MGDPRMSRVFNFCAVDWDTGTGAAITWQPGLALLLLTTVPGQESDRGVFSCSSSSRLLARPRM